MSTFQMPGNPYTYNMPTSSRAKPPKPPGIAEMLRNLTPPQQQFLLSFAAGTLSQPYSDVPRSPMQDIGAGMTQGLNTYQQAMILDEEKKRYTDKQESALARKVGTEHRAQDIMAKLGPNIPEATKSLVYEMMISGQPQNIPALLATKEEEYRGSSEWSDSENMAMSEINAPRGDPRVQDRAMQIYQEMLAAKNARAPLVQMGPGEEEGSKLAAKRRDEAYGTLQEQGAASRSKMYDLQAMNMMLKGYQGGPLAKNVLVPFQGLLEEFGVNSGMFNFDTDIGRLQAAKSLEQQMVLGFRSTAEGAGMPGHLSDRDVRFLEGIPPGMSMSEKGRDLMYKIYQRRYQNSMDAARHANKIIAKNGGMPPTDFMQQMQDYTENEQSFLLDKSGNLTEFGKEVAAEYGISAPQSGSPGVDFQAVNQAALQAEQPPPSTGGASGEVAVISPTGMKEWFDPRTGKTRPRQ